jgi:hypothetical protein
MTHPGLREVLPAVQAFCSAVIERSRLTNGGETTIWMGHLSGTRRAKERRKSSDSWGVMCIFQLAAMMGLRK